MLLYGSFYTIISGTALSVDKLHEVSLAKSLPQPWPTSLIAMVPSTIRTEPGTVHFSLYT